MCRIHLFVVNMLPAIRRNIALRYLHWQRKGSEFNVHGSWFSIFCTATLGALLLGMILFVFAAGVRIGPKATTQWAVSVLFTIVFEMVLLSPLRIWVHSVALASIVGSDMRQLYQQLMSRARLAMLRTSGLMRNSNSLIHHFNPACRAARYFPELDISRLLLSINDNDFPSTLPGQKGLRRLLPLWQMPVLYLLVFFPTWMQTLLVDVFACGSFAVVFVGISIANRYRVFIAAAFMFILFCLIWFVPYLRDLYKLRKDRSSRVAPFGTASVAAGAEVRRKSDTKTEDEEDVHLIVIEPEELEYDYSFDDSKLARVKSQTRLQRLQQMIGRFWRRNNGRVYGAGEFDDLDKHGGPKERVVDDSVQHHGSKTSAKVVPTSFEDPSHDLHREHKKKKKHKSKHTVARSDAGYEDFDFHFQNESSAHPLSSSPAAKLAATSLLNPNAGAAVQYQVLSKTTTAAAVSSSPKASPHATKKGNAFNPTHVALRDDESKEEQLSRWIEVDGVERKRPATASVAGTARGDPSISSYMKDDDVPIGTIIKMGAGEVTRSIPAAIAATGEFTERRKRQERRQLMEQQEQGTSRPATAGRSTTSVPDQPYRVSPKSSARPVSPGGRAVHDAFSVADLQYAAQQSMLDSRSRLNAYLHSLAHEETNWNVVGSVDYFYRPNMPANYSPTASLEREFVASNFVNAASVGGIGGVVAHDRPSTANADVLQSRLRRQRNPTGREGSLAVGELGLRDEPSMARSISPDAHMQSHVSNTGRRVEIVGNSVVSTTARSRIAVNYNDTSAPVPRTLTSRPQPPPTTGQQLFSRTDGVSINNPSIGASYANTQPLQTSSQGPALLMRTSQLPSARPRSAHPAAAQSQRDARAQSGLANRFIVNNRASSASASRRAAADGTS